MDSKEGMVGEGRRRREGKEARTEGTGLGMDRNDRKVMYIYGEREICEDRVLE